MTTPSTYKPSVFAALLFLLPLAAFVHAGLFLMAYDQWDTGTFLLSGGAALLLTLIGLLAAPRIWGVLLAWVGLALAAIGLGGKLVIGLLEPDLEDAAEGLTIVGLLLAAWSSLQWWIGTQPAHARRVALGLWVAGLGALAMLGVYAIDSEPWLMGDAGLAAVGFVLAGLFLRRGAPAMPIPKPVVDKPKPAQ